MRRLEPLRIRFEPLRVALALAALNIAVLFPEPFRAAVVLPLALILPGRALLLATRLPQAAGERFQRLALEGMCSVALYPLLLLVFAAISVKVTPVAVLAGTDALVVGLLAVAAFRLLAERTEAPPLPAVDARPERVWSRVFVAAVLLAFAAASITRAALPQPHDPGSVFFSLAGRSAHVRGVQVVTPGSAAAVTVSVANTTSAERTYRVSATIGGLTWEERRVRVPAHASWHGALSGPVPPASCPERLSLALVPLRRGEPVRTLTLYFRTRAEEASACRQ
ncbi:MAG: DUF1616 domain-containing protein [Actinomycetota bacterium]|nr:DUF1616 domain-containing protein [Actinomycetota bacterium]